jgi:ribulose-phosphate 3-epimerase
LVQIVPTILAQSIEEYNRLLKQVVSFAPRVHLDFMDGVFAPTRSINVIEASWPSDKIIDLHLMLKNPSDVLETVISMSPYLTIVHAEANGNLEDFMSEMQSVGIKAGVALLPDTSVESVRQLIKIADHVLVFAGHLGYYGGTLDKEALQKISEIKSINSTVEVGVDGGVNNDNAALVVKAGADVLYSGGYIQKAANPKVAYDTLVETANK